MGLLEMVLYEVSNILFVLNDKNRFRMPLPPDPNAEISTAQSAWA
jgi:hypothetical protein